MVLEPYRMRHGLLHYSPDVEVPADCAIAVLGTSTYQPSIFVQEHT